MMLQTQAVVQHDYHDHGKDPILLHREGTATAASISSIVSPQRGASKQFPFKLYKMLRASDASVVGWQPHGRAMLVRNQERFVNEILPL